MLEFGKEPTYIQKRRDAAQHQRESQKHQENIASIYALANGFDARHKKDSAENYSKACREKVTIVMLFLAFFASFGGDVIFYLTMINTDTSASAQIKIMSGQLREMQDEQRPWIGPPVITAAVTQDKNVSFTLTFKNVGRTPTRDFVVDGGLYASKDGDWYGNSEQFCSEWESKIRSGNKLSVVPQSDWPIPFANTPYMSENRKVVSIDQIRKMNGAFIAGCAIYTSRIDGEVHKTAFGGEISIDAQEVSVRSVYAVDAD